MIIYTSNGETDRADNLITVCTDCHTSENHKKDGILYKWMINKKTPVYKEPPFMNALRIRVFKKYPNENITYESTTIPKRIELGLEKTHFNDAIVISGIEKGFIGTTKEYKITQFRKRQRSLHEAIARKARTEPNSNKKRKKHERTKRLFLER